MLKRKIYLRKFNNENNLYLIINKYSKIKTEDNEVFQNGYYRLTNRIKIYFSNQELLNLIVLLFVCKTNLFTRTSIPNPSQTLQCDFEHVLLVYILTDQLEENKINNLRNCLLFDKDEDF